MNRPAAREMAKNGGGRAAKPQRRARAVRRDGREPTGLGEAFTGLVTEQTWELPVVGGSLRERWAAIAPDLAGYIAAVGFDAQTGQLTLRPESAAWAAKARLEQLRIIRDANEAAGRLIVRTVRVLAPALLPSPPPRGSQRRPRPCSR
ncbi:DUF721 domain-containing protein [Streptomyces sp. NPDC037389]|uniref:DUF721 domain-containing protein n=1 Tax=Streptomyces sp. NPDC037389 TaxID=3155369 RepID=UPI0033F61B7F